ncbi:hypothetical protein BN8_03430 [Fibrisoma limi BUZ 3]|uniref:Uncharacterized protein n=1 Tax=Fibrisoma limi BUZ 3 TaxID=1185876 RepID=I2GK49_9BACT|nr:alpha/beta hydrolase-fold protein [Fibrisoma limi]CCH54274.1 hypothetical protein BN8_03430 [Fibrisoma limi BUZ 3]
MKTHFLIILLALLPQLTTAQTTNQIMVGHIDSLQSKILREKRKIWVHLPESYSTGVYAKQRYPVVYLLDGDAHFSSVAGMIDYLSSRGNALCPEMIVVGILNTDRMHDLTPGVPSDTIIRKFMPTAGGGEAFTSFIETELMPYIEAHYPTQPYNLLIGHSLGGLMVVNTLLHRPKLFNAYIAIDPSIWWEAGKLLAETKQALASKTYPNQAFYLGFSNLKPAEMSLEQARTDTTDRTKSIRQLLTLLDALTTNKQNGLLADGKFYPDDDHLSVPLITEYDAIRFMFSRYKMPFSQEELFNPAFNTDSAFVAHYKEVSRWMGYAMLPPESLVNQWAYTYLQNGPVFQAKAEALFRANLKNYPQSPNVYDSMGDYYLAQKDTTNAIANFKKALALKEITETRKKLTDLLAKTSPVPVANRPKNKL